MMHTPPQHNTTNPPGQIRDFEKPLGKLIEEFREEVKEQAITYHCPISYTFCSKYGECSPSDCPFNCY